jgi:ankyrin repeat protein
MASCFIALRFAFRNGVSPLYLAVLKNSIEMVTLLLDHGANVNALNRCYTLCLLTLLLRAPNLSFLPHDIRWRTGASLLLCMLQP